MTIATPAPPATRTAQPKPAIRRDQYHRYFYEGARYPGLTGVIKVIDKGDGLIRWASRKVAESAVDQLGDLPKLLERNGRSGLIEMLAGASEYQRDKAGARGVSIHALAERIANGQDLGAVDEAVRVRAEHYAAWWAASGWRVRLTEAFVINKTLGYGGTLDLLAYDGQGRTTLADVKSGAGVYGEVRLQLLGYGEAEVIAPQGSPVAYPMPHIDRYVVLHVTETGVTVVDVEPDDVDRAALRACLPLSAWQRDRKGKVA